MIVSSQALVGRSGRRRGTILPFLAATITALVGFLALAIDLGMLAMAKSQAQNAADLAVLTAMRTVTGDSGSSSNSYNSGTATTNAQNILGYNKILGSAIPSSQLTLTYGSYDYNQSTQTFSANYPPTTGKAYTAAQATITTTNLPGAFTNLFGVQIFPNVTATAQAVHRPRDIALVMDLSGSMRLARASASTSTPPRVTPTTPTRTTRSLATIRPPAPGCKGPPRIRRRPPRAYTISPSNTTVANSSYSLTYVNNFYQNAAYATTLIRAFDSYSSTDGGKHLDRAHDAKAAVACHDHECHAGRRRAAFQVREHHDVRQERQ